MPGYIVRMIDRSDECQKRHEIVGFAIAASLPALFFLLDEVGNPFEMEFHQVKQGAIFLDGECSGSKDEENESPSEITYNSMSEEIGRAHV
jgi:hypothetical protein